MKGRRRGGIVKVSLTVKEGCIVDSSQKAHCVLDSVIMRKISDVDFTGLINMEH